MRICRPINDPIAELHRNDPPLQAAVPSPDSKKIQLSAPASLFRVASRLTAAGQPTAGNQLTAASLTTAGKLSEAAIGPMIEEAAGQQQVPVQQLSTAHKSLVQACRQASLEDLHPSQWDRESLRERDQENCSCLHALMQHVYTGMQVL